MLTLHGKPITADLLEWLRKEHVHLLEQGILINLLKAQDRELEWYMKKDLEDLGQNYAARVTAVSEIEQKLGPQLDKAVEEGTLTQLEADLIDQRYTLAYEWEVIGIRNNMSAREAQKIVKAATAKITKPPARVVCKANYK